jgi:hypothetical protein
MNKEMLKIGDTTWGERMDATIFMLLWYWLGAIYGCNSVNIADPGQNSTRYVGYIKQNFTYVTDPRHPDQLCGSPSLLSNGYRQLFPRG